MSNTDYPQMSPSDAVVALKSLPRRWRSVVVRPDDDKEELVRRAGADGQSAMDHLAAATAAIRDAASALAKQLSAPAPGSGAASSDSVEGAVASLEEAANGLAAVIERATVDDWKEGDALGRVQSAVGEGVSRLRSAEKVMHEVKGK